MISELGHFLLIAAFCLNLGLISNSISTRSVLAGYTRFFNRLESLLFTLISISFLLLIVSFINSDFSVKLVANNSHELKPILYKVAGAWGNHEGSLLLWVWILGAWSLAVAIASRGLPLVVLSRVLAVLGLIGVGFIAFSLFTSNPFERLLPGVAAEGNDLNLGIFQPFG